MITQVQQIENLLDRARGLVDRQENERRLRGETFNVFSILRMERLERYTHSAFLCELLNPQGSHLMGATFLKLFLEVIQLKNHIRSDKSSVTPEYYIGPVDNNKKEGGYIDIYIEDINKNSISIENKIDAGDQEYQIERYVNHNNEHNKVFYLTLFGDNPSEVSVGNSSGREHFSFISYSKHILQWLEKCLKETAEHPILRESIRQYIILIKKLTNQLMDNKMEQTIQDLVRKNYSAAKAIETSIRLLENNVFYELLTIVKDYLLSKLPESSGWVIELDNDLTTNKKGLHIRHSDWKEIEIRWQAHKGVWKTSYYGVAASDTQFNRSKINDSLKEAHAIDNNYGTDSNWPAWKGVEALLGNSYMESLMDTGRLKSISEEAANKLVDFALACQKPLAVTEPNKK